MGASRVVAERDDGGVFARRDLEVVGGAVGLIRRCGSVDAERHAASDHFRIVGEVDGVIANGPGTRHDPHGTGTRVHEHDARILSGEIQTGEEGRILAGCRDAGQRIEREIVGISEGEFAVHGGAEHRTGIVVRIIECEVARSGKGHGAADHALGGTGLRHAAEGGVEQHGAGRLHLGSCRV